MEILKNQLVASCLSATATAMPENAAARAIGAEPRKSERKRNDLIRVLTKL
ncbi:UNVERIFIED_ORG: hypothetical protein ABIC54_005369 [Burkholderia sp. 1263]|jgi:hypothetical protein|uniref:hypothetical protein n=1 Tax=Paraburkholderia terricola TaxID=169427 RepID=UPI002867526D|nr:hypothetical protein [Paraburkholderia terricola]MDR6450129.1 hypothetical protein [Paraburkholderia terricola]